MRRELFHIFGPFSIQSYGLAISLGILVFSYLFLRHPKRASIVNSDQFTTILMYGIIAGLAGGRMLALLNSWHETSLLDSLRIFDGGFSVLGSILAILIFVPLYLKHIKVPIFPFLDLVAIHAPLLQSISRIGCFAAGCCFGKPTSAFWSVCYTDIHSYAPVHVAIHPTQLYSSILLLFLFIMLYFFLQFKNSRPGQLLMIYLMGSGAERFIVDFFRADQEWFMNITLLSLHQLIALFIFISACAGYLFLSHLNVIKSIET